MNTDWYELIEPYNLGRLPAAQAARFEAAMQADPALAAAVYTHRTEWEMQELVAENLLRTELRQRLNDLPDTPDNPPSNAWKFLLPLLPLLGAMAYFFFLKPNADPALPPGQVPQEVPAPPSNPPAAQPEKTAPPAQIPIAEAPLPRDRHQLALAAYRAPEGLSGIRGPGDDATLSQATQAFAEKNYRRVLELLDTLPEDDRQEALSLRAHAGFSTGNFAAAARDFEELEAGGIYRREAQWFGLLSRMAMPETAPNALKKSLEQIQNNADHPYRNDARALMRAAF